jgi:hypothetical protein
MQATVSLLDARHSKIVKDLWAELNDRFGVRGIYVTPFPHMSYHVADSYDLQAFQPALAAIAADSHPIQIHTSGLGVFTGGRPILYVPVVRSPELTELHRRILSVASAAAIEPSPHYTSEHWSPHITLGYGDLAPHRLAQVLEAFGGRDFTWDVTLDNLSIIDENGGHQALKLQLPLGAPAPAEQLVRRSR